jgi:hypothetical protein
MVHSPLPICYSQEQHVASVAKQAALTTLALSLQLLLDARVLCVQPACRSPQTHFFF